jgi:O-antigen ligase
VQREVINTLPTALIVQISLLVLTLTVFVSSKRDDWANIKNDYLFLMLVWFIISLLEVVNPGAAFMGWVSEIITVAVYPLLVSFCAFLIFKENKHLDIFIILLIVCSTFGALWGIRQLKFGLTPSEQHFVLVNPTHLIWGRLRVFSFYNDAGQFGASQAAVCVTAAVLALGPFKKWIRIFCLIAAALMFYGMLISGTRGALFALLVGAFTAVILFKQVKAIIIGGILLVGFFCFLKFTHIGDGNYQIFRLRTGLNPNDASFNVRLATQRNLREYMSSRPFGGGLGVLGFNARYNGGTYLATVQPDSYYVKVWAMYGIVGLTIWLSSMFYILGKCYGIVLKIKDRQLQIKAVALTSGFAGILLCSYGNEVINNMPSSIITDISIVFIYLCPLLEEKTKSKLLT